MTLPTTARFGKFRVLLDVAGSGSYSAPCGFTSKSFSLSKDLTDVLLPDCADPDAVSWVGRDVTSLSGSVSGEGVLASESISDWMTANDSTDSVAVKIEVEFSALTVTWTGNFHISSFEISADQGGRCTANIEMQSDGALTRVEV